MPWHGQSSVPMLKRCVPALWYRIVQGLADIRLMGRQAAHKDHGWATSSLTLHKDLITVCAKALTPPGDRDASLASCFCCICYVWAAVLPSCRQESAVCCAWDNWVADFLPACCPTPARYLQFAIKHEPIIRSPPDSVCAPFHVRYLHIQPCMELQ